MDIQALGGHVRRRRQATGLTQDRLARLASLSRQTIVRLEAGTLADLSFGRVSTVLKVLGLEINDPSLAARMRKRGLWMAAKSSSVSYRGELSDRVLEQILASGAVVPGFEAHLGHFLDELAVEVVVMAVEETAQQEGVPPATIWVNVSRLARLLDSTRTGLWM
ncbi:MAG: helix-turn-helix transcriptional regulator [Pseudomonadota bacterium]